MTKIILSLVFVAGIASAQTPPPKGGPCQQIENDCKTNGYVGGEAGQGKGLWWDCMCPLIAPNFPEPSKNVLTVPSDSGLVGACRAHPRGPKILSRCAAMLAKKNAKAAARGNPPPSPGH